MRRMKNSGILILHWPRTTSDHKCESQSLLMDLSLICCLWQNGFSLLSSYWWEMAGNTTIYGLDNSLTPSRKGEYSYRERSDLRACLLNRFFLSKAGPGVRVPCTLKTV